jgi:hypothetical protein
MAAACLRSARFLRLFKLITSPMINSAVLNAGNAQPQTSKIHSAKSGYNWGCTMMHRSRVENFV